MSDRKYVIARLENLPDIYGSLSSLDVNYVAGFIPISERSIGWDEQGLENNEDLQRVYETTSDPLRATHFESDWDADFVCAVFNLIYRDNKNCSFLVRYVD